MHIEQLDYHLPSDLIATEPTHPRDAARLLVVHRTTGRLVHCQVRDLPNLLGPGDLMVFNRSKVVPAWFQGHRQTSGGKVTGLYLSESQPGQWQVMLQTRGRLQAGEWIDLPQHAGLQLLERGEGGLWLAQLHSESDTMALLERIGRPPLPPYIRQQRKQLRLPEHDPGDVQRYNTVYAAEAGSVAAPTAGLHFTDDLLTRLDRKGVQRAFVTLHVGMGTFAPVRTQRLEDHVMHHEPISVPADTLRAIEHTRRQGGRIIPVGTTSVRALESLPQPLPNSVGGPVHRRTNLYILPGEDGRAGFKFRFADGLVTNFHLPRSTLLALVAALPGVGVERLMQWYQQAVQQRYRFYSYGDAMLLI